MAVAVLTKNQAAGIEEIVDGVRPYAGEILVVDGHSTDDTRDRAGRCGARVVLDDGRGKGDGVRAAMAATSHDVLVILDGDGSYAIDDIPRLATPALTGDADLVVASRWRGGSDASHVRIGDVFRMFGNGALTVLVNARFGTTLTDSLNGFRALRMAGLSRLRLAETGAAIELELVVSCLRHGGRVHEVPSHEHPRRFGSSSTTVRHDWFPVIRCLARYMM